jgi:phosphatidylserine/phosphatidylglycerophosphate/cardiolipin synthase-like enzyme
LEILAEICEAQAIARAKMEAERNGLILVLGGPEVAGVPVVDTPTMARSLFAEAAQDVIIATYVIYTPAEFFQPLANLLDSIEGFRVRIIVDLSPKRKTKDEPLPIVENRFKKQFLDNSWPGKMAPELWFDPRPFSDGTNGGGVMHAKALIVDKTAALITSANFTEAAHQRNIEAGVLLRNQHEVSRLRRYFEGLMECGHLRKIL